MARGLRLLEIQDLPDAAVPLDGEAVLEVARFYLCVDSNFSMVPREGVCVRFHAIFMILSPWPRRHDLTHWLISTQGSTTPMRGVKLMRLAGCCSRRWCKRRGPGVSPCSCRVLICFELMRRGRWVQLRSRLASMHSTAMSLHSPAPKSPETSRVEDRRIVSGQGSRRLDDCNRRAGAGRELGFAQLCLARAPRRRCVAGEQLQGSHITAKKAFKRTEATRTANGAWRARCNTAATCSHRSTRRRPPTSQEEPAPATWRAHHGGSTKKRSRATLAPFVVQKRTDVLGASFNLVNNVAGCGFLTLTAGAAGTGYLPAIGLVAFLGAVSCGVVPVVGRGCAEVPGRRALALVRGRKWRERLGRGRVGRCVLWGSRGDLPRDCGRCFLGPSSRNI